MAKLLRHPPPFRTESLLGYLLRLSELNGYISPWALYQLVGLSQSEVRGSGLPVEKLAWLSGRPVEELREIAYLAPPGQPRWATLLGNPIVPADLQLNSTPFCPLCVTEGDFIEATWHLRFMVGCPMHLCAVVSKCPTCRHPVNWYRPGLLDCSCGANLAEGKICPISNELGVVLALLRAKTLKKKIDPKITAPLLSPELIEADLRSILALLRFLGKYRLLADGGEATGDPFRVMLSASHVLTNWPNNFAALMNGLSRVTPSEKGAVGGQFAGFYQGFIKNKAIGKKLKQFLLAAFLDFTENQWGRGYIDRKLYALAPPMHRRYTTLSEFSAQAGVQPRTAQRLLRTGAIESKRVLCGNASRIIVDTDSGQNMRRAPGSLMRTRSVAASLGIPVAVLLRLRRSGIYVVRHLPPGYPGWHESDVRAFQNQIISFGTSNVDADGESITFRYVMQSRHVSPAIKEELIRHMLTGDIEFSAKAMGQLAEIQFNKTVYWQFIETGHRREVGETLNSTEAASILRSDRGAIRGLIQAGELVEVRANGGLRVTRDSVLRFAKQYITLASHARASGTSSRALMDFCSKQGIPLLHASVNRHAGPQPFIRVDSISRISMGRSRPVDHLSQL